MDTMPDNTSTLPPRPKPRKRRIPPKRAVMVPRSKPEPPRTMRVQLTVKHSINGQPYGPGVVEVPENIGQTLTESEQRNRAEERGLFEKRASVILPGGRSRRVPPETFDDPDAFTRNIPPSIIQ